MQGNQHGERDQRMAGMDMGGGRGGMSGTGMMGGMMRGGGGMGGGGMCPMCGQMSGMGQGEQEEGPHRGKGPRKRTDEQIRSAVEEALTEDSWLDASEIQVRAEDGIMTLTGAVENRQAKRRVEDIADEVAGVRDVRNELEIAGL